MTVNFVTIRGNGNSYEVAHMSFPKRQGADIILSVSRTPVEQCVTREAAEIAARSFADLKHFFYVPENRSVITSIPFQDGNGSVVGVALELTPDGGVIGQGSVMDRVLSIAEATQVAQSRGLPLVLPQ